MFKIISLVLLLLASGYSLAETVADTHTDMAGCESCHENGAPSADYGFENTACIDCHGDLSELDGEDHTLHVDILACSDCHIVHEMNSPKDSCVNCH